ncbi:hypothetical protein AYO42_03510 [Rhizomicrobium sp. SCGC AG-212-E05]|nr:hypothetical protein AYO42_03510 [Rhizomicrobium sp. SCGC AG-212-E05]
MSVRPAHALTSRMTSLTLVMLLHGLLLMLLLHAFTQKSARPLSPRETILRLLPLLRPQEEAAPSAGAAPRARRSIPAPVMPPAISTAPAAPDVTGLGMRLFGCAPEQLARLTPEERARCATGLKAPDRSVVTIPKSHVQDPARRAAELRAKNSPPRLPCSYAGSAPAPHGTAVSVMVDPVCAIDGLLNGFAPLTGLPK